MVRRKKEEALETKEKLLESALDIMSEKSFSKVTMNEIAENVGLSKGALYWHFKDKNDVIVKLVEHICLQAKNRIIIEKNSAEPLGEIREFYKKKMYCLINDERFQKMNKLLMYRHQWPDQVLEQIMQSLLALSQKERLIVESAIKEAQDKGLVKPETSAFDLSWTIVSAMQGVFTVQLRNSTASLMDFEPEKHIDFIFDSFEKSTARGN